MTIDEKLGKIIAELQGAGITLEQAEDAFRKKYVVVALAASGGNVTQASRRIGVHRNTLHNHLKTREDHELLRGTGYRKRRTHTRARGRG
jgi:transcriptional regulator of acetoin/glycerol metabolism